jgi:GTP pyrophosphokinase
VVTPHAKNRIKSFLKKQNFEDNYREGLERLEKAATAERVKLGSIANHEHLKKQARAASLKSVEDLIAAIGYGEYSAESVVKRIKAEEKPTPDETTDTLSGAAASLLSRNVRARTAGAEDEAAGGLQLGPIDGPGGKVRFGDLLFSLAKCCAPIPATLCVATSRAVAASRFIATIAQPQALRSARTERLVTAEWTCDVERAYQALIAIESKDRLGPFCTM